jgi:hypothetical protein
MCVLLASTIFLCFKQFKNNNWNRCISSDGKGYYAYLPAIFIYHDLQYNFVNSYESKYYLPENKVNFTIDYNSKKVNKYWLGTALLMSPFFLIAHFVSTILSLPNDGYSFIYQAMVAFAAVFYTLLGLFFIRKLLLLYYVKEIEILITLFALVFATNLFYYTVAEPSMSHVYSFFVISSFVFWTKKFYQTFKEKCFIYAIVSLAIIILIRPSNGLIVFSIPFLAGDIQNFKKSFIALKLLRLLPWFGLALLMIFLQLFYYKISVGNYIVYSYGSEKFNFLNPHLFEFLFSYRRGLFIYAPVLFLSILGFKFLYKISTFQTMALALFLFIVIYILSSWWMWYYGGGFGMRPMIDFYVFFAILLASFLKANFENKLFKFLSLISLIICVLLAQIQTYQRVNFILPWDGINKEIYWKIFLKTDSSYIGKYSS